MHGHFANSMSSLPSISLDLPRSPIPVELTFGPGRILAVATTWGDRLKCRRSSYPFTRSLTRSPVPASSKRAFVCEHRASEQELNFGKFENIENALSLCVLPDKLDRVP